MTGTRLRAGADASRLAAATTLPVPYLAVGLIASAALAFEVTLTRLLSIVHWHHFAGMVISLALLGYGASGTLLFLLRSTVLRHSGTGFALNAIAFAVAAPVCFQLVQGLALDPSELPWDWRLWWRLGAIYALLAIPFFAAANSIGIALMAARSGVHRVYATDLLGAGVGALAAVPLMALLRPEMLLTAVGLLGLVAALLATVRLESAGRRWLVPLAAIAAPVATAAAMLEIGSAPYKDLSRARAALGAEVLEQRHGPLGQLTLLTNAQVPFRFAPGLSLASAHRPPAQHALFVDGSGAAAVPQATTSPDDHAYLGALTSALPYQLLDAPRTLVIGLGGGSTLLQAVTLGATAVDVTEHDPERIALVSRHAGIDWDDVRVQVLPGNARALLAGTGAEYDLIQLDRLDRGGAGGLGAHSAGYLLTTEAVDGYVERLRPGGILAVTLWLEQPPRAVFKLVATLRQVLERRGIERPSARLAVIRAWKTVTVLLKNGDFDAGDATTIRGFCRSLAFDPVYFDGIRPDELNRYHRLDTPVVHAGLVSVLGPNAAAFAASHPFRVAPASDDRPYFDDFSRWRALPQLLGLPARAGLAHLDWGYWIQVATLAQATLLGMILILAPLVRRRTDAANGATQSAGFGFRMLVYFLIIGVAFLMIEIAFVQKLQLLLGHPVHAVAVTLAAFLVTAGIGSAVSGRFWSDAHPLRAPRAAAAMIAIVAIVELWLFDIGGQWLLGLPLAMRLTVLALLIAPLGFCMGIPFPWGMRRLARTRPALVPWAWGVNGFASVVSAILSGLLAMEIGFSGLLLAGAALYLTAVCLPPSETSDAPEKLTSES